MLSKPLLVVSALLLASTVASAQAPKVTKAAALGVAGSAAADAFVLDQSHTNVAFKVRHLGISTVSGRFAKFSGSFRYDSANPAASRVDVTVDVASVDTDIDRRDEHLRSEDFFFVEKYPTMTFASREVERVDDTHFLVKGDLTIRGITKPVVLDATLGGVLRLESGATIAALHATTTINRFDYGLAWNRLTEGVANVAPQVVIVMDIEARRAAPTR